MQRSFYEILEDRKRLGRTVFFSSHILSEVERVCDRVAIVRKGELVALTDIGELLDRRRRRVEIRFTRHAPQLEGVPGISDVHVHEDVLTCQLEGDPEGLVAALEGVGIKDLLIEPARLEEAFMEYYADDAEATDAEATDAEATDAEATDAEATDAKGVAPKGGAGDSL
jgi:ABC-2 type transport system ATP-binding protein